jgi:hypothetical protein
VEVDAHGVELALVPADRITGLRMGITRMPVPTLILEVRAATAVRIVSASWIGKLGSTPSRMWSQAHSDS